MWFNKLTLNCFSIGKVMLSKKVVFLTQRWLEKEKSSNMWQRKPLSFSGRAKLNRMKSVLLSEESPTENVSMTHQSNLWIEKRVKVNKPLILQIFLFGFPSKYLLFMKMVSEVCIDVYPLALSLLLCKESGQEKQLLIKSKCRKTESCRVYIQ